MFGLSEEALRCFPNGTIVVPNPNIRFKTVNVTSGTCRLRVAVVHVEVWLDHCQLDAIHIVTFWEHNISGLVTVDNYFSQPVVCKQIPNEGVTRDVSVGLHITEDIPIPTKDVDLLNVVRIITRLGEDTSGREVQVQDARKILWDLQLAEFRIIPDVCSYMSDIGVVILQQNGCSTSSNKVSDFAPTAGAGGLLTLFPFGFTDRADSAVSIVCSVRVCLPTNTENCTAKCGFDGNINGRRRRRYTQKRSTFGLRSEVATLTLHFDTPDVTSSTNKTYIPMAPPTTFMLLLIYVISAIWCSQL
ncbi:uncharacterized protein LOC127872421 [Dreissena polymorpha]|uniref:ZP domain-containing protein n=1 Tax=Dreissena polymorpha TaxID=45954 RepID=A0A9D4L956_DREPO|nr:uncharacterized protein LOC127872421 [Dreissena polymorpha]KAH3853896.1 hypothetical protein DPMN_096431 [Dreissena polymorpha]